jgi:Tfp pilus assembly protein PilX
MVLGSVLESPEMNFSNYGSIQISLSLQSFGNSANNSNDVKIECWNGATWIQVGALLQTTGTVETQTVQLPYTFSQAKIRITAPNSTTKAGARVYSIEITGVDMNSTHSIVSTTNIVELSYYYNHGPSDEKILIVGGSDLIDNVMLTSPPNFEISTHRVRIFCRPIQ